MDNLSIYDCDQTYLTSAIENKKRIIAFENRCVADAMKIIDDYEQQLTDFINRFVQSRNRNSFIASDKSRRSEFVMGVKAIMNRLQDSLITNGIDVTIQSYQLSSTEQFDLLQDYLDTIAEQADFTPARVLAGEQTESSPQGLTKPTLTAAKAESLVRKKRGKFQMSDRIKQALKELSKEVEHEFDKAIMNDKTDSPSINLIRKMKSQMFARLRRLTEYQIRQSVQDAEETAYDDIWHKNERYSPAEFQRVEVLDKKICMLCMSLDTTTNEEPLGLIHTNCRGIDIPIYYDSKGKRIHVDGIKYSRRRLTFDERFNRLSQKEQIRMLGKGKFELYKAGKLKPSEFLVNGAELTLHEAERHAALKTIRKYIKFPRAAIKFNSLLEEGFPPISQMDIEQLRAYEKVLGEERKILGFVPKKYKKYSPAPFEDYVAELDGKVDLVRLRRQQLKANL